MRPPARLVLAAFLLSAGVVAQDTPLIAVAANLSHPVTDIAQRFQDETGLAVRLSMGSSGDFTRQIRQGAPYQVFLSADRQYADLLTGEGLTRSSAMTFAIGRIGAFVPAGSTMSEAETLDDVIRLLWNGRYRRIALANPEHAPFGRAAAEALQNAGVWAIERDRVLLGENAAQTAQFSLSGNIDIGIMPYSYALLPGIRLRGKFFLFPADWHRPLEQSAMLLKGAGGPARRFREYLSSETARAILQRYGYAVPEQ